MKQTIYEEFLYLYKNIEQNIPKMKNATIDSNVKWLEDKIIEPEKRNKLYICRIIRNYIQHNSDYKEFLTINDGMITFLKEIYIQVLSNQIQNKDIMLIGKQFIVCKVSDNIIDTLKKMDNKKQEYIPIFKDEKLIGIFSNKVVRQMLIKYKNCEKTFENIVDILKISTDVKFVKTEDTIEKTIEFFKNGCSCVFCTDNGKSTGKIEGIITEKEIKKMTERI